MEEQPTCGQGIAAHAELPTRLGELIAALAGVLETHMTALDLADVNAKQEYEVYQRLAQQHRHIAALLQAVAADMAAQRDLPMGKHDMQVMMSAAPVAAFRAYVQAEQELLALLQQSAAQDQQMLHAMSQAGASATER